VTDSEKLDRILNLCRGMADKLNDHDAELKFLHAQVDIHSEDAASFSSRLREVGKAVDQLTKIAQGHATQLSEHRKSIHELGNDEERRAASGNSADDR